MFQVTPSDKDFDLLYPPKIRSLSSMHWTPVSIVKQCIDYFGDDESLRVLDIGSGSGKFCLVGAMLSKHQYCGIEKRSDLVHMSRKLAKELALNERVTFIHQDILEVDFGQFDAFYFYNPFFENLDLTNAIDKESLVDEGAYARYTNYVQEQLEKMPIKTKIVTYCTDPNVMPASYQIVSKSAKGKLLFWMKGG
ncbi:class I SAM-dependent methyltransferase [Echinicola sp. CAU 1574]|uniref:Class I SAM-dependent methyltransferase n=1 Tax=Echinicola arenosa TaxID=2774144 RepID=A0ABR9ARX0_9BACT|nr:class I SAM-dependent methyltransferase [Echinicola arenosa]MBD8490670.1 class I SAM-dependent methyltransferase [Echinicola arenosa]